MYIFIFKLAFNRKLHSIYTDAGDGTKNSRTSNQEFLRCVCCYELLFRSSKVNFAFFVYYFLFIIFCLLFFVYYFLFIIFCLLFFVYYFLFIIFCLLFFVYYFLFIIFCLFKNLLHLFVLLNGLAILNYHTRVSFFTYRRFCIPYV